MRHSLKVLVRCSILLLLLNLARSTASATSVLAHRESESGRSSSVEHRGRKKGRGGNIKGPKNLVPTVQKRALKKGDKKGTDGWSSNTSSYPKAQQKEPDSDSTTTQSNSGTATTWYTKVYENANSKSSTSNKEPADESNSVEERRSYGWAYVLGAVAVGAGVVGVIIEAKKRVRNKTLCVESRVTVPELFLLLNFTAI